MESTMLRTSKRKGSLQVMLMALVVLVIGITAPGYGDDDHDDGKNHHVEKFLRLSGPALEGTLTLFPVQTVNLIVFMGKCRGPVEVSSVSLVLPGVSAATFARLKTAKDLEGLLLPGVPTSDFPLDETGVHSRCLRTDQTVGDTIVLIVVKRRTFVPSDAFITADVVLRQVVQRLHKDRHKDKDKDKDEDED